MFTTQKKSVRACLTDLYNDWYLIHSFGVAGIRTLDLVLKRDLLYQLSYYPMVTKLFSLIYLLVCYVNTLWTFTALAVLSLPKSYYPKIINKKNTWMIYKDILLKFNLKFISPFFCGQDFYYLVYFTIKNKYAILWWSQNKYRIW